MCFNIAKISNKKNLSPFLYYYFPLCVKINFLARDSLFFNFFTKEFSYFVQKCRLFCSLCAQMDANCEINARKI